MTSFDNLRSYGHKASPLAVSQILRYRMKP